METTLQIWKWNEAPEDYKELMPMEVCKVPLENVFLALVPLAFQHLTVISDLMEVAVNTPVYHDFDDMVLFCFSDYIPEKTSRYQPLED